MASKNMSKKDVLAAIKGDKELKSEINFGLDNKTRYYVNTGHYGLNRAVSGMFYGGYPSGRVVELYGDPSAGKSLLMLAAMRAMQVGDMHVVEGEKIDTDDSYILLDDTEKAYFNDFCKRRGVNIEDILEMDNTETVEKHFKLMEKLVTKIRSMNTNSPLGVFLDSISQLSTDHEQETGMDKSDMSKAKKVHQAMRLYSDMINRNDILYLCASHVIANIGNMYGPKKVVKGGAGLAFQSSVRCDLTYKTRFVRNKMKTEEGGDRGETFGTRVIITCEKNKVNVPMQWTVVDIYYEHGIDPYSGLWDYFLRRGELTLLRDAKGGKNPVPAAWTLKGHTEEFSPETFVDFLILHDVLGVKAAGGTYLPQIRKDAELVEEQIQEGEAVDKAVVAPKIPTAAEAFGDCPPTREAKR